MFKIVIQFKIKIFRKIKEKSRVERTGLIDFGLPCTLEVNSCANYLKIAQNNRK